MAVTWWCLNGLCGPALKDLRYSEASWWSQSTEYKALLAKNKKYEAKSVEFVSPVQRLPVQKLEERASTTSTSNSEGIGR
eukprot:1157782-Pelagomonas_calceolata.AAC.2